MEIHVPMVGVLLATVAAMLIGSLWYSPYMFGKQWQKITGATNRRVREAFGLGMFVMFIISFITAYVLAHFIIFAHAYNHGTPVADGLSAGLWAGLGLGATTIFAHGLFEPRDRKVLWINAGNRLVTLAVMGLIIGATL